MGTVTFPAGFLLLSAAAAAQPLPPGFYGVLVGDTELDAVYIARDLNNNGHANDPGEARVYFDASNASGLPFPTDTVTDILWTRDAVFIADAGTDSVYRLRDLNRDDDANDPGEANVWFSAAGNARGFRLPSPGGVAMGGDGFVYILGAGTTPEPFDAIYRTRDNNNDGDAQDEGEATLWFDIQGLIPGSVPFDLVLLAEFPAPAAYFTDGLGPAPDAVWRASDTSANGAIDPGEFNILIDDTNARGVPVSFGIADEAPYSSILLSEGTSSVPVQSIWRLGVFNPMGATLVWDELRIPPPLPVALGTSFALAEYSSEVVCLTSSGDEAQDNIFLLADRNFDHDFLDAGETTLFVLGHGPAEFPNSARSLAIIESACYADCDHSTGFGSLDVFDFLCFQNLFVAEHSYACCCDTVRGTCFCDVFDFLCFQNSYAAGCP